MKKVIIFKEHYKNYIFDASTEALLLQACISVIERRATSNHFRYFAHGRKFVPTGTEQSYLDLTEEELEILPQAIFETVSVTRKKLNLMISMIEREHSETLEWTTKLETFLSLPANEKLTAKEPTILLNGEQEYTAIWLLKKRASYAGESFEIVNLDLA